MGTQKMVTSIVVVVVIIIIIIREGRFGKERKEKARQKGGRRVSQGSEIACGRWRGEKTVYRTGNKGLGPKTMDNKTHQGEGGPAEHLRAWDHIGVLGLYFFPTASYLPKPGAQLYQFRYVNRQGRVCGQSPPFQFREPRPMDELVTLEETDGGSDILLVVPKATVLQVRAEQQSCSWARAPEDNIARGPFPLHPPLAVASTTDLTGSYTKPCLQESLSLTQTDTDT